MVEECSYDTHFESGIGVAVHGVLPAGAAEDIRTLSGLLGNVP